MNKIVLLFGLLTGIFFCYRAGEVYTQAKRSDKEIKKMKEEIMEMKSDIEHMADFSEIDMQLLTDNVRRFREAVNIFARYHNVKSSVQMDVINGQSRLVDSFTPSVWKGVVKAQVKVGFPEIFGADKNITALVFMGQMEKVIPLQMIDVDYQGKSLSLEILVFGKREVL